MFRRPYGGCLRKWSQDDPINDPEIIRIHHTMMVKQEALLTVLSQECNDEIIEIADKA